MASLKGPGEVKTYDGKLLTSFADLHPSEALIDRTDIVSSFSFGCFSAKASHTLVITMHPYPALAAVILQSSKSETNISVLFSLGSSLRIGILHARWNTTIIDALVAGTKKSLTAAGVKEENIVVQTVPGSYELPFAVQRYVVA